MSIYYINRTSLSYNEFKIGLNRLSDAFKRLFIFLSISSIWVAATGFFATFIAFELLEITPRVQLCLSVFLMVFGAYNLNKLADMKEDAINMPERLSLLGGHKKLVMAYSAIAYAISALLAFLDTPLALPVIFFPLIASLAYSYQIIPGVPRFKDIPLMKNIFNAFSWAVVCVILPAIYLASNMEKTFAMVFYFILLKIYINAVLFDVRDIEGDKETGAKTLPVLIGARKTIIILLALNCMLLPWLLLADSSIRLLATILILYGFAYILYFSKRRNPFAMDFLVDGEWMFISIALLLSKGFGLP
ncbi:MAG: UbiA family prenyltransferase [Methanotrichaceae archaeon]